MREDWVLASVQKENIAEFMQFVIDKNIRFLKELY
jgi:hypothetical protein